MTVQNAPDEQLAIKMMTSHYAVDSGMSLNSLLPGSKRRADQNLLRTLRDHVTYPPELIGELIAYSTSFADAMKGYDERIQYNWVDYSDDDKRMLLRLANDQALNALAPHLRTHDVEFVDFPDDPNDPMMEQMGEWTQVVDAQGELKPLLKLSNQLLHRNVVESVGLMVHEQGHGIVTQYTEQAKDVSKGKSGLMWSKYGDNAKFYYNPEEALVRAFEINTVECFAPGSSVAARIRASTLDKPGYAHMAAAKQFFNLVKK